MILVTGATGTVGRALLDVLATDHPDIPVRAMTRRPESADLPAHVEVVGGDLGDPASLGKALVGVDRVFLLSSGPEGPAQDRNLVAAAQEAGVSHIVKLSAINAGDDLAEDPIAAWHREGEDAIRAGGIAWTFLRPNGFMSNALSWAPTVASHDTVYHPYADGRLAPIDPRDIAGAAATVLTAPGHDGQAYPLSGPESLGPAAEVAILGEVLGRPVRYVEITPEESRRAMTDHGVPPVIADAVVAVQASSLRPGHDAPDGALPGLLTTASRTFRDWAADNAAAFARR
jgi:(4-alkanoyl-5-oxo-2,5-dihydrofuran-3-yl)methyl phosphate reductase